MGRRHGGSSWRHDGVSWNFHLPITLLSHPSPTINLGSDLSTLVVRPHLNPLSAIGSNHG
jgi:hypothetical protein